MHHSIYKKQFHGQGQSPKAPPLLHGEGKPPLKFYLPRILWPLDRSPTFQNRVNNRTTTPAQVRSSFVFAARNNVISLLSIDVKNVKEQSHTLKRNINACKPGLEKLGLKNVFRFLCFYVFLKFF